MPKKVTPAPGSELARAVSAVARRPGREVSIVLLEPLLSALQSIADSGGLTLPGACTMILERAIADALRPMQARAGALATEIGATVLADPDEN